MYRFCVFLVSIYIKLFYRIKFYGTENIPKDGVFIVCSNHVSGMDMLYIGCKVVRKVHWMAKAELFKIPFLKQLITAFGAYPIKRGTGDLSAVRTTMELLKDGKIVGIFPQGTRTTGKDISQIKVRHGAAMFSVEADVPVLPVAIEGGNKLFSKGVVVFGKPYKLPIESERKYTKTDYTEMSKSIIDNIYKMLEDTKNESNKS